MSEKTRVKRWPHRHKGRHAGKPEPKVEEALQTKDPSEMPLEPQNPVDPRGDLAS